MVQLSVDGADKFAAVAKTLKQAGDKDLKKELRAAIASAVEPMTDEVRDQVAQYLPTRYAPLLADSLKTRQSWRTSGSTIGLVLTGSAKGRRQRRHVQAINAGVLRHPVFGNRNVWVAQPVRRGFWDEPMTAAKRQPAREIGKALDRIARRLARKY